MKPSLDRKILAVPRTGISVETLCSRPSPMLASGASMGSIIARRVRDGGGKAIVSLNEILIVVDTDDGVNVLLDNFDFTDKDTLEPLFVFSDQVTFGKVRRGANKTAPILPETEP